jgi:hypothetical protein
VPGSWAEAESAAIIEFAEVVAWKGFCWDSCVFFCFDCVCNVDKTQLKLLSINRHGQPNPNLPFLLATGTGSDRSLTYLLPTNPTLHGVTDRRATEHLSPLSPRRPAEMGAYLSVTRNGVLNIGDDKQGGRRLCAYG